eukprot:3586265-Pyramimonas_sp.AAC.1
MFTRLIHSFERVIRPSSWMGVFLTEISKRSIAIDSRVPRPANRVARVGIFPLVGIFPPRRNIPPRPASRALASLGIRAKLGQESRTFWRWKSCLGPV